MALHKYVADHLSIPVGSITVISHSISIDPQGGGLERAKAIAATKQSDDRVEEPNGTCSLRLDPNGEFVVTTDQESQEIVVQHLFKGQVLKEYRARRAEVLENQLARDCALSEISHALYLGRERAKSEALLRKKSTE